MAAPDIQDAAKVLEIGQVYLQNLLQKGGAAVISPAEIFIITTF